MKLYQAEFNFEVAQGDQGQTLVFPSLREARGVAKRTMQEMRDTEIENFEHYHAEKPGPNDVKELSCTISEITTMPITRTTLCAIINSSGGRYVRAERPVLALTLPTTGRMRVARVDRASQVKLNGRRLTRAAKVAANLEWPQARAR